MKKLIVLLVALFPLFASAQDIVDRLDAALGVSLPDDYKSKVKDLAKTNKVLKDGDGNAFTEGFIKEQMKQSWGISKGNQLIFVWSAIYNKLTNNDLYDGSDGDDKRLDEFGDVIDNIEQCGNKYVDDINAYMKKLSAEARQQSAEARQQSAEARQQSAEARQQTKEILIKSLEQLIDFYNIYKESPSIVRKEEIEMMKKDSKFIVTRCKSHNIDYKSKLGPEVMKFYGIE
jgi:hypothetical protein